MIWKPGHKPKERRKKEEIKGVLTEVGGDEGQESESGEGGCGPRGASCWGDRDETFNNNNRRRSERWRRRRRMGGGGD